MWSRFFQSVVEINSSKRERHEGETPFVAWKVDALIHHLVSIVLFLFRPLVFEGNLSLVVQDAQESEYKGSISPSSNYGEG